MNKKQRAALQRLEAAFAEASIVGVRFWGVDNELLAMPVRRCARDKYDYLRPLTEQHDAYGKYGKVVDTSNSYVDSGGW